MVGSLKAPFVIVFPISSTLVENLQKLLQSGVREEVEEEEAEDEEEEEVEDEEERDGSSSPRLEAGGSSGNLPRRAGTFGGYDRSPSILPKSESSHRPGR